MAPTTRNQLKATLYLLSALGTYHTWGRTVLDGSLSHLLTALHGPNLPYILPGTESPLRTRITGIVWPIDYLLDMLLVFFWEAVDGSHPATSAIGIYFLAQYLSVLTGIYVDSARRSQSGRTTIPIGLILGYLLPAVAMALPSPGVVSNDFQQLALVAWNLFPALVYVSMQVFHYVLLLAGGDGEKYATTASTRRTTLRIVYAVSLWISFAVHMGLLSISLTTVLFPTLWAPETLDDFHPARLLIPPVAVTPTRTVGDGVLSFFLWDQLFGYIVGILVAWSQLRTVLVARGWYHQRWAGTKVLVGIVGGVLIAGPGSVCLGLNWVRDELLMLPTTDTTVAKGNRKEE
ncbi:hypothetical protein P175DRAFT_0434760 [Aspergillus ochraceoroseus IBT 24754]|uniref:Uncharacterized protein n=1 Tax=Aspergillus ochraceoroseus IBT 24754 TaxID=1392256 RepID=A0A2T5LZP5_9EURO|nr:uncharacterized protein P175DRAFT_0434760 [Aspergillus ochraceoroseus IBT 24754]PTU21755.1 hypothetical protein P175DRAFT_0434760 [Aspergillus ochraceoroseus IBT 24754]